MIFFGALVKMYDLDLKNTMYDVVLTRLSVKKYIKAGLNGITFQLPAAFLQHIAQIRSCFFAVFAPQFFDIPDSI